MPTQYQKTLQAMPICLDYMNIPKKGIKEWKKKIFSFIILLTLTKVYYSTKKRINSNFCRLIKILPVSVKDWIVRLLKKMKERNEESKRERKKIRKNSHSKNLWIPKHISTPNTCLFAPPRPRQFFNYLLMLSFKLPCQRSCLIKFELVYSSRSGWSLELPDW
jgi:hypothetical protein